MAWNHIIVGSGGLNSVSLRTFIFALLMVSSFSICFIFHRLEFLEPPALEEGILENYPIFFDIVLNHISGDSPEFSHAVSCLRELFKMLGRCLFLY